MKKLMLMAVVATIGVVAQANAIKWGATAVNPSSGDTATTGYASYLFVAGDSTGKLTAYTVDAITADIAAGGDKMAAALAKSIGTSNPTVNATTGQANFLTATSGSTQDSGSTLSCFCIILDDTKENYMVAMNGGSAVMEKKVATGSNAYQFTFGSQASNTWQSIPEPTSGLLLLLGVAGLALKRRRA